MVQGSAALRLLAQVSPWQQAGQLLAAIAPAGPAASYPLEPAAFLDSSLLELALGGQDLMTLSAGVDDASRTSNALSKAGDALGVIGGLLQTIRDDVAPAGTSPMLSPDRRQAGIDDAISTLDSIASGTEFGGRQLLDGTFTAGTGAWAVSIPSFLSADLGLTQVNGTVTGPLASLVTGGANELASGNAQRATAIVDAALSQVNSTEQQIQSYQATALGPDLSSAQLALAELFAVPATANDLYLVAAQMLTNPAQAFAAAANANPRHVFTLLQP